MTDNDHRYIINR